MDSLAFNPVYIDNIQVDITKDMTKRQLNVINKLNTLVKNTILFSTQLEYNLTNYQGILLNNNKFGVMINMYELCIQQHTTLEQLLNQRCHIGNLMLNHGYYCQGHEFRDISQTLDYKLQVTEYNMLRSQSLVNTNRELLALKDLCYKLYHI